VLGVQIIAMCLVPLDQQKWQRLVNRLVSNLPELKHHALAEGQLGEKNRHERRGYGADNYLNTDGALEHGGDSFFDLHKRTATLSFFVRGFSSGFVFIKVCSFSDTLRSSRTRIQTARSARKLPRATELCE
jgi:hypothetical protein